MQKDKVSVITCKEIIENPKADYLYVDIRNKNAYEYGCIPDAINVDVHMHMVSQYADMLPKDKTIVVYCTNGERSGPFVDQLLKNGYKAYMLLGGYQAWMLETMGANRCADIEYSIRKKFHKKIFSRFAKAVKEYQLLQEGDKVAVCISGGKDSMLMAKCFQELQRHRKFPFSLTFLVMDPGYHHMNRIMIEKNAEIMGIPLTFFDTQIFDAVTKIEKSPCYICARMRRGYLYSKARELGCNKIALGHHYDDVIETILMGMLYGGQIQTMMPKLHSTNFEGMELIRPLYYVREEDIKHWRDYNKLHFLQCACHFTDGYMNHADQEELSKRQVIKKLIKQLKEQNPYIEANIFKSVENVNLSTIIAYKQKGKKHHFLDSYKE